MGDEESSYKQPIELKKTAEYGTTGEPEGGGSRSISDPREMNGDNIDPITPAEEGEKREEGEEEGGKAGKKKKKKKKSREVWDNKFQFILTLVGYAVGLGNIWRFSYLVAKNGGSAFLIPYIIMLFLLGVPAFYLELLIGQGMRLGPVAVWLKLVPNLAGIGIASMVVIVYISLYYNVIIGWVIFYFFNSFRNPLVWSKCFGIVASSNYTMNELAIQNFSGDRYLLSACLNQSTEFFWYENAVQASDSISHAGGFDWRLFLCLMAAWVIMYLCLFRGIKWSGKIVYFSATFPYVVLVALFFRAIILPGAGNGIKQLFIPEGENFVKNLFNPEVWLEASSQIFFSLGIAVGSLIALSSYTKPHYNALKDSVLVCLTNSLTSIFASIIVFSIIGFKAETSGTTIGNVTQGPGLAFVVFTEALAQMPIGPFWALLFFIMLFLLGVDSQFGSLEGFITVVRDFRRIRKFRKEIVIGVICLVMFIVSIPFILGNGVYLFQLFDQFASTLPLLAIGFFEFIAIGWVYGVDRFFHEVAIVTPGRKTIIFWTILWQYVNPIVMAVIFIASIVVQLVNPLEYTLWNDYTELKAEYPGWARFVAAVLVLSSLGIIPLWIIGRLILYEAAREQALQFFYETLLGAKKKFFRTKEFFRSLKFRRMKWRSHVDEDSEDVPYTRAGDDGGELRYGTDTYEPKSDKQ